MCNGGLTRMMAEETEEDTLRDIKKMEFKGLSD